MRSHVLSDGEFRQAFGNWLALGILGALVLLLYLHSWYATRMIFQRSRFRSYFPIISHSVLLHLIPVAVLLIIPVTVIPLGQSRPPGPDVREQKEPEPGGIPRTFEQPEDRMDLSGARSSGEEGEQGASRSSSGVPPVEVLPLESLEGVGPRLAEDEQRSTVADPPPDEERGQPRDRELVASDADADEDRPLPGKRQKQTYSNYLSVKIRAPEKDLRYWDQMPQPYSAVFEYRIDAGGLVHSVRVLEPSGHSESDRMTVQLIESMGTVLPPPGERDVLVTELFWNTGVDDPTLPTELQRQLSREFDGRVIEPLQ
jgi:hypothetical protein